MSNHGCISNPCPVCHPVEYDHQDRQVGVRYTRVSERIARLESEATSCPCSCHKPKHEARQPSPLTMIGRRPRDTSRQPIQGLRVTDQP